jgi:NADH-quinone oxidoreductase subunit D
VGYGYEFYTTLPFFSYVGINGDCFERYRLRILELKESAFIIKYISKFFISKSYNILKYSRYNKFFESINHKFLNRISMEYMIKHFKYYGKNILFNTTKNIYISTEAPKGEFGVFIYVKKNEGKIYRIKIRAPGFFHLQSINLMSKNLYLADLVAIIGTQDIVFGEIDR